MIKGMSGFGWSSFFYNGIKYNLILRSVNFKFLEFIINLPEEMINSEIESRIKDFLSKYLRRGRITVQLTREPNICYSQLVLNKETIKKYMVLCKEIRRETGIKDSIGLKDILSLPNIFYFQPIDNFRNPKFIGLFNLALEKATAKLLHLRQQEGRALLKDLMKGIIRIKKSIAKLEKRTKEVFQLKKCQLSSEEYSEFLKNYNINEELSRLKFFIKTFLDKLAKDSSAGKMLDFIIQEMMREINTLGAKFRDEKAFYHCINIKDQIDKIREQIQNVE